MILIKPDLYFCVQTTLYLCCSLTRRNVATRYRSPTFTGAILTVKLMKHDLQHDLGSTGKAANILQLPAGPKLRYGII